MSNPASMYGHLLLKINENSKLTNDLLDYSLNYGAIVPDNENPIVYVIKGVFGGYDAAYSDKQFYRHQHNYSDIELRDMWEYELKLTQDEVDFIIAHIWELLGKKFNYYFMDENCAFHVAKLLELVLDDVIINDKSLWVLPSAVAKGLVKSQHQNQNLVNKITYIPSRESELHQVFNELNQSQQLIAHKLIQQQFDFSLTEYQQLSESNKKQVIEALILYLEVYKQSDGEDFAINKAKTRIIRARLSLSIGRSHHLATQKKIAPPHQGMNVSKISLGYTDIAQQNYINSGFRMTYFDKLSSSVARNEFTNLEMLDIELLSNKTSSKIYKVDLVDIQSLYKEAIPGFKHSNSAWGVRVGYKQLYNNCLDCGIYFAEGDWGKSAKMNDHLVYALIGGTILTGVEKDIFISAKLGFIAKINNRLNVNIEIKQITPLGATIIKKSQLTIEFNYQLAKNLEMRLFAEQQKASLIGVKMNYFWGF